MTLGERVHTYRRRRALTLVELGKAVGVDKMTIWRLENGKIDDVKGNTIAQLARTLRVSSDYLLGLSDDEPA